MTISKAAGVVGDGAGAPTMGGPTTSKVALQSGHLPGVTGTELRHTTMLTVELTNLVPSSHEVDLQRAAVWTHAH